VDSLTIIDVAQDTGTVAVIKSPHLERLTPRVSRRGRIRMLHHRIVAKKVIKKNTIIKIKTNHSQY
jgi:phosphopantothenoylcysteine synthetase/decarboxylase